jgi:triacylglycerol lipase
MELLRHLAVFASITVALVAIGSLLYLVVSFVVMRSHTPARTWRHAIATMLGEALAIALTQPLIPLFYLVGRRMGGPKGGRPVVFVHGYFQNRADFIYLAWLARRARLGPLYGFNYNWTASVTTCASHLARFVERVCRETGHAEVSLVAHSLGGVVSLEYLASKDGAARVRRCVTIASPHAGVKWRGGFIGRGARDLRDTSAYMRTVASRPIALRALSIFSTHDNIVHPASTSALAARGGDDQEVSHIGHLGMLFSREVADAVIHHLSS